VCPPFLSVHTFPCPFLFPLAPQQKECLSSQIPPSQVFFELLCISFVSLFLPAVQTLMPIAPRPLFQTLTLLPPKTPNIWCPCPPFNTIAVRIFDEITREFPALFRVYPSLVLLFPFAHFKLEHSIFSLSYLISTLPPSKLAFETSERLFYLSPPLFFNPPKPPLAPPFTFQIAFFFINGPVSIFPLPLL